MPATGEGANPTITVAVFKAVPPGPVQVTVNVVVEFTPVSTLSALNPLGNPAATLLIAPGPEGIAAQ